MAIELLLATPLHDHSTFVFVNDIDGAFETATVISAIAIANAALLCEDDLIIVVAVAVVAAVAAVAAATIIRVPVVLRVSVAAARSTAVAVAPIAALVLSRGVSYIAFNEGGRSIHRNHRRSRAAHGSSILRTQLRAAP